MSDPDGETAPSGQGTESQVPLVSEARFYFVAFVDRLGQTASLRTMDHRLGSVDDVPKRAQEVAEAGRVTWRVRDSLSRFFSESRSGAHEQILERVPEDLRDEYSRVQTPRLRHRGFSDCFVVSVDLGVGAAMGTDIEIAQAATGIRNAMVGLSHMCLEALKQGVPLRAGLDVGLAVEMFDDEVYGPALLRAYHLESAVAEYPRAAIGVELLRFLQWMLERDAESRAGLYAREVAGLCLGQMVTSAPDDGWPMLHLLSPLWRDGPGDFDKTRELAAAWVQQQVTEHQAAGNEKLARRYSRLDLYFRHHAPPEKAEDST